MDPRPRIAALAVYFGLALALFSTPARADYAYKVYSGSWDVLPNFDALTPIATGTSPVIDLSVTTRTDTFGLQFTGTLTVQAAGTYSFSTTSDDGSDLRIDRRRSSTTTASIRAAR